MKRVVITCGFVAGAIGVVIMGVGTGFYVKNYTGTSEIIGYTSLLLSVSFIFVGIKIFRDKYNGGVVSFGKAFLIGLYISQKETDMFRMVRFEYMFT